MRNEASNNSVDRVASVAKALKLIEIITIGPKNGYSLTELAKELNVSKSSALALLRTLVDAGYIRIKAPGPRYLPGMALLRLGDQSRVTQPIDQIAQTYIHHLAQETGLTIRVAINDGGHPVFISRADAPGSVRFHTLLGVRESPQVSSAGKAILATLSDDEIRKVISVNGFVSRTKNSHMTMSSLLRDINKIRERKYAIDDAEDVDGVFCVGAAFFDHSGECAGAISATGIKTPTREKKVGVIGNLLVRNAEAITRELRGQYTPRRGA
jgi:IclR family acetate operon transcriptional repressor